MVSNFTDDIRTLSFKQTAQSHDYESQRMQQSGFFLPEMEEPSLESPWEKGV